MPSHVPYTSERQISFITKLRFLQMKMTVSGSVASGARFNGKWPGRLKIGRVEFGKTAILVEDAIGVKTS
jgi:hypothetical protein